MSIARKGFDLDLKDGLIGEANLRKIFANKKIEVKRDYLSKTTGNIAIEFECRGVPSGIATTEAEFWCFILEKENLYILVPTEKLRLLCAMAEIVEGGDDKASKMYLLPKWDLIR